jgi:hypothetical protein
MCISDSCNPAGIARFQAVTEIRLFLAENILEFSGKTLLKEEIPDREA